MSEDTQTTIQGLLGTLEGLKNSNEDAIYTCKSHFKLLKSLSSALAYCQEITSTDAERVLTMSLHYKMDIECAPYVLSIISSLIKMNKAKTFEPAIEFLPSALAILDFLKKNCGEMKLNHLRALSLQVLMSHPQAALIKLVKNHCPVLIETFELLLSITSKCTLDTKIEALIILQLLRFLPAHERSIFVKEGIPLWLSGVMPTIIQTLATIEDTEKIQTHLTNFELLSSELFEQDYFEYPEWKTFLRNVVDIKKYPMIIKLLLDQGKDTWHRIWIVIIKLLKGYLTINYDNCTPVNALLPVVETAFKKDCIQRVRAFACWDELIRNFSSNTNTNSRRVKLIVVPLKSNNTKTEDTAIAKFNTWWLFVRKFKLQLETFTELILIEFVHFLFGTEQPSKSVVWVGRLSESIRKLCLEAFVELLGHSDCEESSRCTNIEPLCGKAINTAVLAKYWVDWLYALKCALKVVAMDYKPETQKNLRCIWKSFMLLMSEVADGSARRDCFNDLVEMLSVLSQDSVIYENFFEMVIKDLTLPLIKDDRMQTLLHSSPGYHPMHKMVTLISDKAFDSYYERFFPQDVTKMLQPIVSHLLRESMTNPEYTIQLLDDLPPTDSSLKLWTTFIQIAPSDLCLELLSALLRWPIKMVKNFKDVKDAALAWYKVYNAVREKLDTIGFSNEISKLLTMPMKANRAANYFILFALIGVVKLKPDEAKMAKLEELTDKINDNGEFEPLIPPLVETLTVMLDNISSKKYENLAPITLNCVNNVLKMLHPESSTNESNNMISIAATFSDARTNMLDINKTVLSDALISSMKSYIEKSTNESIKKEVVNITSSYDERLIGSSKKSHVVSKEFASPKVKEEKKYIIKEPSIVNTVVENGEEYVVVKSNWKFNPRNLTENQKEKFKRKRDIPALYQDLSQSQDEFKRSIESQDTSQSSSKSSKSINNDASEIIKSISEADIVPKIMENIRDSAKNTNQKICVDASPASNDKLLNVDKMVCTFTKSPRMAFKDRVFRNVRNLIEKSSPSTHTEIEKDVILHDTICVSPIRKPSNEKTDKTDIQNQLDNVSKSSVSKPKAIDKEDSETVVTKSNTNKVIAVTAKKDSQNIKLVHTPATKTKTDDKITNSPGPLQSDESPGFNTPAINTTNDDIIKNSALPLQSDERPAVNTPATKRNKDDKITNSSSLQSDERPARMKRKPKKFDDTLFLPLKKTRSSNNNHQTNSQESSVIPDITITHLHTTEEVCYNTDNDEDGITAHERNEAATKGNENTAPTISDDVAIALIDVDNIESHVTERDVLITPTTPIADKTTEKSPEKPTTTVEIPSDKDGASHGIENAVTIVTEKENYKEKPPSVKIPIIQIKKPSVEGKRDLSIKLSETNTTPLNKLRKTKARSEIRKEDEIASPVYKLLDETQYLNKKKSPVNKSIAEKNVVNELDVVVPQKNKLNKDKDSQKSAIIYLAQNKIHENDENSALSTSVVKKDVQLKSTVADKQIQIENNRNKYIKKTSRKSRIESELMIDMVERHTFLKAQSEKRLTRKKLMDVENNSRRKSLEGKLNKSKLESTPKSTKNIQGKKILSNRKMVTVEESQDKQTSSSIMDEPPCSEDIIESSQDSTITTISVKSTKQTPARQPVVSLERLKTIETQDLIKNSQKHERTDIELPQNKTAEVDNNTTDLTENMDTEPIDDINASIDAIILNSSEPSLVIINSEPVIGPETQELAEADTQPNDPGNFIVIEGYQNVGNQPQTVNKQSVEKEGMDNDITQSLPEVPSLANIDGTNDVSSPFKNDDHRKQDFLNNTIEISPIKIRSPEREKKSPSPETSSDFVVIKLTSPVHSNGEPFEKHGSPEFFTEDKVTPDKRDESPPRTEVPITNTSPSPSLSLKKNRPSVRSGGRAAQMLDLISVNSDLKITKFPEHAEPEDNKKATKSTPARRNLRILYNSAGENTEISKDLNLEEDDNFLKLQRTLPTVTSSPSGPILKRKLIDIMDEATASPTSKRKRVSFHDPPVSTSITVHKYIEPLSLIRSPQSSAKTRLDRQTRSGIKSPKRLENAFNLDSVLSKTIESFVEAATPTDDTQNTSLDITPIVEIVKSSELNDTDPFYPDLIDCKDPIDIIATELSSSAMRELFVKELEGKVETVGDLAKMTELEINRLCIKAPKIKVAKKVLTDFAAGRQTKPIETVIEDAFSEPCFALATINVETQTDQVEVSSTEMQIDNEPMIVACTQTETVSMAHPSVQTSTEMQTDNKPMIVACTQTETVSMAHTSVQTSTEMHTDNKPMIVTCTQTETVSMAHTSVQTDEFENLFLAKGGDLIKKLNETFDDESFKILLFDVLMAKSQPSALLNLLLKYQSKDLPGDKKMSAELSFIRDFLGENYGRKDLITLCIQLLEHVNDTSAS